VQVSDCFLEVTYVRVVAAKGSKSSEQNQLGIWAIWSLENADSDLKVQVTTSCWTTTFATSPKFFVHRTMSSQGIIPPRFHHGRDHSSCTANDDVYVHCKNTTLTVAAPGVMDNDSNAVSGAFS